MLGLAEGLSTPDAPPWNRPSPSDVVASPVARAHSLRMSHVIGIDLGTTNSVVAFLEGKPQVMQNAEGNKTTPLVVLYREDGEEAIRWPSASACSPRRFRLCAGWSRNTTLFIVAAGWQGMTGSEMVSAGSGQVLAVEVEVPGSRLALTARPRR